MLNFIALTTGHGIELIVDAGVVGGGGCGGGVGSTSSIEITIDTQQHFLLPGQSSEGVITVTWTSGQDLTVNSLILGDTPLMFAFDVPITLKGSGLDVSTGEIPYTVFPPSNYCSSSIFVNCVEAQLYLNPFEITANVQGATVIKSGEIPVDTRLGELSDFILIVVLFVFIVALVYYLSKRKKGRKSTKHKSHKMPKQYQRRTTKPLKPLKIQHRKVNKIK